MAVCINKLMDLLLPDLITDITKILPSFQNSYLVITLDGDCLYLGDCYNFESSTIHKKVDNKTMGSMMKLLQSTVITIE